MSAIVTSLLKGIKTAIDADSDISSATTYRGYGLAPTGTSGDYVTWNIVGGENLDFMRANTSYYKDVDIQFMGHTSDPSPAAALTITEYIEALFRFNNLDLEDASHYSTEIGSPVTLEDPEADGWNVNTTLTFSVRTATFESILAQAEIIGDDITVTNVRTGARKSIFDATTEVAANTVDSTTVDSLPVLSSMAGATNLVDTDLTNWTASRSTTSDNGDNTYRLTDDNTSGQHTASFSTSTLDNDDNTFCIEIKAGTLSDVGIMIETRAGTFPTGTIDLTDCSFDQGALDALSVEDIGDGWCRIFATENLGTGATQSKCTILLSNGSTFNYLGDGTGYVEIRNMRAVDSTVAHPAFPDGSSAGATYGSDLLTCTPTFGSQGTIVQAVKPYGWKDADYPLSAARYFQANVWAEAWTSYNILYFDGTTNLFSESNSVRLNIGDLDIQSFDWDGDLIGIRTNEFGTRKTATQTASPAGTLYIGNKSDGTRPFHGAFVTLIFDRVLTDAEYEIVRAGLQSRLANLELY